MNLQVTRTGDGPRIDGPSSGDVDVVNRFLAHLEVRAFSPSTVRAYAFDVLNFLRFCATRELTLAAVQPVDLFDYLDGQARPVPTRERAALWLRTLLDAHGRSVGTARTYAGRLTPYLTWAATVGVDPAAPQLDQLAAFARWLVRTPSHKHRPGRRRRRAADCGVAALGRARSPATV